MMLFTFDIAATNERCVDLPGFSHWGQPRKRYGTSGDEIRTVYFYAKHRRQASKHLGIYCGINTPCNLSGGQKTKHLLSTNIEARVNASEG